TIASPPVSRIVVAVSAGRRCAWWVILDACSANQRPTASNASCRCPSSIASSSRANSSVSANISTYFTPALLWSVNGLHPLDERGTPRSDTPAGRICRKESAGGRGVRRQDVARRVTCRMRWTSVDGPVEAAKPNLTVLGTGVGAGNRSTRWKPLPSWKSMSTVATGADPGGTVRRTVRFTGSSSASARVGVTRAGMFPGPPWSRPGSVDGQVPAAVLLAVPPMKQYPSVPFPGTRTVTTVGAMGGTANVVPAGGRRGGAVAPRLPVADGGAAGARRGAGGRAGGARGAGGRGGVRRERRGVAEASAEGAGRGAPPGAVGEEEGDAVRRGPRGVAVLPLLERDLQPVPRRNRRVEHDGARLLEMGVGELEVPVRGRTGGGHGTRRVRVASAERMVRGLLDRASPRRARQAGGPVPDQPRVGGGSGERLVEQHLSRTRLRRRDEPRRHARRGDPHRRDGAGHPTFHVRLFLLEFDVMALAGFM